MAATRSTALRPRSTSQPPAVSDWAADDRYAEPNEPADDGYGERHDERYARRARSEPQPPYRAPPPHMTAATKRQPPVNLPSPRRGSMGRANAPEAMRRRRQPPVRYRDAAATAEATGRSYRPFCRGRATSVTTTRTSRRTMPTIRLTRRTTTRTKRPTDAGAAVSSSSRLCWAWPCSAPRARLPIAPCSAVRCCRRCRRSSKRTMGRTRSCLRPVSQHAGSAGRQ